MGIREFFVKASIICNAISVIAAGVLLSWSTDLLEINTGTSDPDIFDIKFEIVRLNRSKFALSGFMDVKVDFYDNATIRCTIERSKDRAGPYTLFPMGMEKQTLSQALNIYYKLILLEDMTKCCDNAPIIKEKFKPPLTKRNITCTNCVSTTGNLPDILMEGYYRTRLFLSGPADAYLEILALLEQTYL